MMTELSAELKEAIHDYKSFLPWIEAYSLWSRIQSGVPSHYKCFLGSRAIEIKEKEYNDSLPILTESDAKLIDYAAARVVHNSEYKRKLFEILVLSGWDCIDVFFSVAYVKKLLRSHHEKYSILMLEAKRRQLIESVRGSLILIDDSKLNL